MGLGTAGGPGGANHTDGEEMAQVPVMGEGWWDAGPGSALIVNIFLRHTFLSSSMSDGCHTTGGKGKASITCAESNSVTCACKTGS